jgi:hypothetical protein
MNVELLSTRKKYVIERSFVTILLIKKFGIHFVFHVRAPRIELEGATVLQTALGAILYTHIYLCFVYHSFFEGPMKIPQRTEKIIRMNTMNLGCSACLGSTNTNNVAKTTTAINDLAIIFIFMCLRMESNHHTPDLQSSAKPFQLQRPKARQELLTLETPRSGINVTGGKITCLELPADPFLKTRNAEHAKLRANSVHPKM